jgi:hypothetical protein
MYVLTYLQIKNTKKKSGNLLGLKAIALPGQKVKKHVRAHLSSNKEYKKKKVATCLVSKLLRCLARK